MLIAASEETKLINKKNNVDSLHVKLTIYSAETIIVQHEVGTLADVAVDGWAVTFGTARRGMDGNHRIAIYVFVTLLF